MGGMLLRWGFPGSGAGPDRTGTPPSSRLGHPDETESGVPGGRGPLNRGLEVAPTAPGIQSSVNTSVRTCVYPFCVIWMVTWTSLCAAGHVSDRLVLCS